MTFKIKQIAVLMGLGAFVVGLMTSLSSFSSSSSEPVHTCWTANNGPAGCASSTSSTLTVNGSATSSYTISAGTSPSTITVTAMGFSLSFPKGAKGSTTTTTATNGISFTFSETVTQPNQTMCYAATNQGGTCGVVDCYGHLLQTLICTSPGTNPNTNGSNTAAAKLKAW